MYRVSSRRVSRSSLARAQSHMQVLQLWCSNSWEAPRAKQGERQRGMVGGLCFKSSNQKRMSRHVGRGSARLSVKDFHQWFGDSVAR